MSSFEFRQYRSEQARLRRKGEPVMVDKGPILDRVNALERYITLVELAPLINVPLETLYNWRHKGRCGKVHRTYAQRVMAYELAEDATTAAQRVLGTQRIYRGLAVRGWSMDFICEQLGIKACGLKNIVSNSLKTKRGVSKTTYAELKRIAGKLETQDPYDVLPSKSVNIVKGKSKAGLWVDIGAWDMDTVHLEETIPDWTGACGSLSGYWLHRNHDIPMCEPCMDVRRKHRSSGTGEHLRRYDPNTVVQMHKDGLSNDEISTLLGAKGRTIERIVMRYV